MSEPSPKTPTEIADLEQLLARIDQECARRETITLGLIIDAVAARSFAPLLLVAGLITLAPIIGDIPGVPTLMAVLVLLTAGQMLWQRPGIWLPAFLLRRAIRRKSLQRMLRWARPPARFIDRLLRPRLSWVTARAGRGVIALCCILIALSLPILELIPFSANVAGLALSAFALALIARDGLLGLIAMAFTGVCLGLVIVYFP